MGAAAASVLFPTISTVQPNLHDTVFEEAGAAEHECTITAFSSVQPFPAQTPAPASVALMGGIFLIVFGTRRVVLLFRNP